MYIYLNGCFILIYFGERFFSQVILPSAMLNSSIIVLCNSATAGPKPGMKKEEGLKKIIVEKIKSWFFLIDLRLFSDI